MMTASKALILFCVLAVVGAVLVIGPDGLRRLLPGGSGSEVASAAKQENKVAAVAEPKVESKPVANPVTKAEPLRESESKPSDSKPAGSAQTSAPAAPAQPAAPGASDQTRQATAALPDPTPPAPSAGTTGPRFDVARIDPDGVAVIAGQSAPGATVELLRGDERLDTAVADGAGQFVMTPPKLPPGQYELTLRAKAPNGSVTQSSQSVPVALNEPAPALPRIAAASKDAMVPKPKDEAKQERTSETASLSANAAGPIAPAAEAPTGAIVAHGENRVVIRGDSLWAISRRAYGDGARYARIFSANRDKIRNPDLIYPGQAFVVPKQ